MNNKVILTLLSVNMLAFSSIISLFAVGDSDDDTMHNKGPSSYEMSQNIDLVI